MLCNGLRNRQTDKHSLEKIINKYNAYSVSEHGPYKKKANFSRAAGSVRRDFIPLPVSVRLIFNTFPAFKFIFLIKIN